MAAVPFEALTTTVPRGVADAIRLATREAVNVAALEVTTDARHRVRAVLGPEQRMSRLTVRKRGDKVSRVTAETIGKGGTKINPYYRQADSTTKPVALVGARGPAHLIEHSRRGGYDVRAARKAGIAANDADRVAQLQAELFGRSQAQARTTAARLQRPGALGPGAGHSSDGNPSGFYAHVKPGPISRPAGGPITAAFRAAPATMERLATKAFDERMARRLADLGGVVSIPRGQLASLLGG